MDFQSLLDPDIQKFIRENEKEDVSKLALKSMPNKNWDRTSILNQIKARQKAAIKMPLWLETDKDIIFPQPELIEQASSPATAQYKAELVKGKTFVDLTGGAGVDTYAMALHYENGTSIEQNEHSAALLKHNLPLLSDTPVDVMCADAHGYVEQMNTVDVAIIDPQRRDNARKGKFKFEDCSPNVLELLPVLKDKAKHIIIKASPMMDISQATDQLGDVSAVHIIEKDGNCKEVLLIISPSETVADIPITAVALNEDGTAQHAVTFNENEEKEVEAPHSQPSAFIYEPGPAFIKSGGFKTLCKKFDVQKLHPHTHLYTSEQLNPDFPGRIFEHLSTHKVQANDIPDKKAHLSVRNFPATVDELRKKLKISDGGNIYYFACTLEDEQKVLLRCKKR